MIYTTLNEPIKNSRGIYQQVDIHCARGGVEGVAARAPLTRIGMAPVMYGGEE